MSRFYAVSDLRPHAELDRLLPPQSPDEYEAMKADIAASRIFQSLILCRDGDGFVVIDGRHRLRAATELGLKEVPGTLLDGLGEDERIERGVRLNNRRNLTAEQKRALAADLLKKWPAKSDRALAELVGCDGKTVGAVRAELVATAELPQSDKRESKDGRERPATQPTRSGSIVGRKDRPAPRPERDAPPARTVPSTPAPAAPASAHATAVRRAARRPLDGRIRELIAAANAMRDVDDEDLAAIETSDLMAEGLRQAVEQINRIIALTL